MAGIGMAEFVKARLEEQEAAADSLRRRTREVRGLLLEHRVALLGKLVPGWHDWPDVAAMVEQTLEDVKAKRALVEMHGGCRQGTGYCDDRGHGWDWLDSGGCSTLAYIAVAWRHHEAWDAAWDPGA